MFKEVDDIVRLGKWAYCRIPRGARCRDCPLLSEVETYLLGNVGSMGWTCGLRPSMALIHDEEGPIKDDSCPVEKKELEK